MNKFISGFFCILLVLTCSIYAQDIEMSTPAESIAVDTTVAENSVADTPSAETVLPAESETASVEESETDLTETEVIKDSITAVDSAVAVSTKEPEVSPDAVSHQAADVKRWSNNQVAKMMGLKSPYPHYYPGGFYVRSSYAPSDGVDLGIGFLFALSKSWPVSIGFEPFHLQILAEDFQEVSDETLWIAAAGAIIGGLGPLFVGGSSEKKSGDSTSVKPKKKSMGLVGNILAAVALVPVYAICGVLYIPVVPGSWLGISDRSRLNTQIISEGFHKRSFTYMNDLGLRLSPLASTDGIAHGYLDGGIRFEKNFDADLKFKYFVQLGASFSF